MGNCGSDCGCGTGGCGCESEKESTGGCGCGSSSQRAFLTKEEKMKMLQDYKAELEKEVKGVNEKLKELSGKD